MIEEEGIVVAIAGRNARVSVLKKSACESCAAAGVCHPGDAGKSLLEAANPLGAKPGQKVKIVLFPQTYLKSALVLYGIPVIALVAGAIIAKNMAIRFSGEMNSDLWALSVGLSCLVLSFILIWMYNKHVATTQKYKPVIVQIQSDTP